MISTLLSLPSSAHGKGKAFYCCELIVMKNELWSDEYVQYFRKYIFITQSRNIFFRHKKGINSKYIYVFHFWKSRGNE